MMKQYIEHEVIHWHARGYATETMPLVDESPLSIRVQGHPFAIAERTAGDELVQAAGYCLYAGVVTARDQIASIRFVEGKGGREVDVMLRPEQWELVRERVTEQEERLSLPFGATEGDAVEWVLQQVPITTKQFKIPMKKAMSRVVQLKTMQPLREMTGATHATAIYNRKLDRLAVAEDVGRHNGMDKAIGRVLMENRIREADIMVLSSRISFELVHKAARAGIPMILSVSLPTALAVRLGLQLDMTLCSLTRQGGGFVFCGSWRLSL